jgi:hypothetical protein
MARNSPDTERDALLVSVTAALWQPSRVLVQLPPALDIQSVDIDGDGRSAGESECSQQTQDDRRPGLPRAPFPPE